MSGSRTLQGRSAPCSASRGFGLLEAIVALLILATSGLMLFAWINQNLNGAARIKDAETRAQLQLEAQGWVAKLNPAQQPEGELEIAGMQLAWRSELVEPMRDEFSYGGHIVPRWQLGLYRVKVSARHKGTSLQADWQQLVAGWRGKPGFVASQPESGR